MKGEEGEGRGGEGHKLVCLFVGFGRCRVFHHSSFHLYGAGGQGRKENGSGSGKCENRELFFFFFF